MIELDQDALHRLGSLNPGRYKPISRLRVDYLLLTIYLFIYIVYEVGWSGDMIFIFNLVIGIVGLLIWSASVASRYERRKEEMIVWPWSWYNGLINR